jgi:hypothetical protein
MVLHGNRINSAAGWFPGVLGLHSWKQILRVKSTCRKFTGELCRGVRDADGQRDTFKLSQRKSWRQDGPAEMSQIGAGSQALYSQWTNYRLQAANASSFHPRQWP